MKEMMEVKGEGRLDKVTEKKLRIGNKERKRERERKEERERERKKEKKRQKEREVSKKNGLIIQLKGDV